MNIKINGKAIEVEKGVTILEACNKVNIKVPTLCNMKMIDGKTVNCKGTCRVCVVEIEGTEKLAPACSELVRAGMSINTNSNRALAARRTVVELLLSNHPKDCLKCEKNLSCELQSLASEMGIYIDKYQGEKSSSPMENSEEVIVRDMNKCILCRRCVTACTNIQGTSILTLANRGFDTRVTTFFDKPLEETECTYCGQCVAVCPTAALTEKMDYRKLYTLLNNKDKTVIVQVAPAVRVALGEMFDLSFEKITTGKMVAALKALNFSKVFDTNFAADLTIMEEATEFVERFTKKENLPLITSCCPGWVKYAENNYSKELNLLSTCKSPQQIFGAVAKSYLAEKLGINKEDMIVVSVMPCIAKKVEAKNIEMGSDGIQDVDIVITTRELGKLIIEARIDIENIEEESFDNPLGESSGAGVIFGSSGGVMEAALRTAYEFITGENLEKIDFEFARGLEGIKEARIPIGNEVINVAIASSLINAKIIMEEIEKGNSKYDFIEIMACPGGCVNGGGQPQIKSSREKLRGRIESIYKEDKSKAIRKSHENESIKEIYQEYLGKPNSEKAHKLLHRGYKNNFN